MPTFVYSPGVRILISTSRHGVIDVSDDISDGTVSLREGQSHSANFSLINHRRKYDGVFTPNDKIVIRLKRLKWLQVFAGYLTGVPFFSVYPRTINLSAECTLKRLRFRLWDQGAGDTAEFLNALTPVASEQLGGAQLDDSFKSKAVAVLVSIAEWKQGIHIGRLPVGWLSRVDTLMQKVFPEFSVSAGFLGDGSSVNGIDPSNYGTDYGFMSDGTRDPGGPGYGRLPYGSGKVMSWTGFGEPVLLSGQNLASLPVEEQPYCAIQLPYLRDTTLDAGQKTVARNWWTNRKLLIVNPKMGTSLVVVLIDDGPSESTGMQIGLSPAAMQKLMLVDGDTATVRFAVNEADLGTDGKIVAKSTSSQVQAAATPQSLLDQAATRIGHQYGWGRGHSEADLSDLDPNMLDCSGLIAWACRRNGVDFTGTDATMMDQITAAGLERSVAEAASIPGAILRHPGHIAFSVGDGAHTIEAMGVDKFGAGVGIGRGNVGNRFTQGGLIPGINYGVAGTIVGAGGSPIANPNYWLASHDYRSTILVGIRALMNDEPILPFISQLMSTSMRSFCSAPNGDFIGWFPDYFGAYGTAATVEVHDIELKDFTMGWSDEYLKTHVFTAGSVTGYGSQSMQAEVAIREAQTYGIASVEFPVILQALLNIDPADPEAAGWMDSDAILQRFGARVMYEPMGSLVGDQAEFWFALFLFQQNWARQFTAQAPISFMPELYPGMLMALPSYGIQFYVSGVDHHFSFGPAGGGFETTVSIQSPSAIGGKGLFGLPRGGRI